MYSNFCCSCSVGPEILKIGQSSHKMYSNNILNFQESTILNAHTKKVCLSYLHLKSHVFSPECWLEQGYMKDKLLLMQQVFPFHTSYRVCQNEVENSVGLA